MYSRDVEINFLRIVFNNFDVNNDGFLDKIEFRDLMMKIAEHAPDIRCIEESVTNAVFDYYDVNGVDNLSFEDIRDWWMSKDKFSKFYSSDTCKLVVNAHNIFKTYSKNKTLSYIAFEQLLQDNSIKHDESIFDRLDTDGNGVINFKEFVDLLGWV